MHFTADGVITQLVLHSSQLVHLYGSICHTYPLASVFLDRITGRVSTGAAMMMRPAVFTNLRLDSSLFLDFSILIGQVCGTIGFAGANTLSGAG